jgi:ribosomal protein S6--L-glutamate ligase
MRLVSFDALRVPGLPNTTALKPDTWLEHLALLETADWVLFPEYWQVPGLVHVLKKRIFPSLPTYLLGHSKVETTRALQLIIPQHLPETLILPNTPLSAEQAADQMLWPFVAKVPKSSMGRGVWLIESPEDWRRYLAITPVIYTQERLPIDRDLRIVVVGKKVLTAYWRIAADQGFHTNIAQGGQIVHGMIPPQALALVEYLVNEVGIDHAGFDIAMVGQHPYLLEFNRLFGTRGVNTEDMQNAILAYLLESSQPDDPDHPAPVFPVAV